MLHHVAFQDAALPSLAQLTAAIEQLTAEQRLELFNALALRVAEDAEERAVVVRSEEGQVVRVLVRPTAVKSRDSEEERANRREIQALLREGNGDLASLEWLTPEEVLERFRIDCDEERAM